jgi:AcrR family transcriptional regulator
MALDALLKLKPAKKEAIKAALLTEFTHYPVADAQVARIVKHAGISRGAFYNYFEDLPDAYRYIYKLALADIHRPLRSKMKTGKLDVVEQTRAFVVGAQSSEYYQLMRMHFLHNESYISYAVAPIEVHAELQWAIGTLTHSTIRSALIDPKSAEARLKQLAVVLKTLEG